jgi:hypothetical protein
MASGRRLKRNLVILVLAASGLALLAWTQLWANVAVATSGSARQTLEVSGATAAPGLTALALAGFALAGALAIAGPVIRFVLGLLEVLLGFSVSLAAFLALRNPAAASAGAVTKATGVSGTASVRDVVLSAASTPWPFVALLAGVVMAAAGIGRRLGRPEPRRRPNGPVLSAGRVPGRPGNREAARLDLPVTRTKGER